MTDRGSKENSTRYRCIETEREVKIDGKKLKLCDWPSDLMRAVMNGSDFSIDDDVITVYSKESEDFDPEN